VYWEKVNKSKSARIEKVKEKENAIPLPVMNNPTSRNCLSVIASILENQTRWVLLVFSTLMGGENQI
jgi:hypothetical protein